MEPKISVAIATFNEEKNIKRCLDSVRQLADEIVVVDGGSADKTVAIARKYGAKVTITDNPLIFHINKQKAIDRCTGDWILQLDADEEVSKELKSEILALLKPQGSRLKQEISQKSQHLINGYFIPRKNFFLGRFLKKGGQYPDYTLRLYRKGKGRLPCRSVHEQAEVRGKVGHLKNDLIHWADPSFQRYLHRFNRYTDLIALELKDKKRKNLFVDFFSYMFFKPIHWFFLTYIRHKGFLDGWQGFVFSFFSSLRFPVAYIKSLRLEK